MSLSQRPTEPKFNIAAAIANTTFDLRELRGSIGESGVNRAGIALSIAKQYKLAAEAMVMLSLAFESESDAEFLGAISHLEPLESSAEYWWRALYIQHVRRTLLGHLGDFLDQENLAEPFKRRVQLSLQHSREAGLRRSKRRPRFFHVRSF